MFSKIWNHAVAVNPAWFWNDQMKTVADAILSYYILYHYFKISKIYQRFMRPSNQTQAVMLIYYRRAPHNFKTIEWKPGGDAFITYNILYHYFKISKIRPKYKNSLIVKRSTSQVSDIILDACMQFENYPITTVGRRGILQLLYIPLFQKFAKNSKIVRSSKKAQARWVI